MSGNAPKRDGIVWRPSGANKERIIKALVKRDGRLCWLCGAAMIFQRGMNRHPRYRSIDHVLPRAHYGGNELPNLRLACRECNERRGDAPAPDLPFDML